jgi:hypothetical protein
MSIERLALCHVATMGHGYARADAQAVVYLDEVEGLSFGTTFFETLLLNASRLDLYEETPKVQYLGAEANELRHFDAVRRGA